MKLLKDIGALALAMHEEGVKKATQYLATDLVVKLTHQGKHYRRSRSVTFVLTVGRPNYAERVFIAQCKKAGEKLPVRKVQLKFAKHTRGSKTSKV